MINKIKLWKLIVFSKGRWLNFIRLGERVQQGSPKQERLAKPDALAMTREQQVWPGLGRQITDTTHGPPNADVFHG